MTPEEIKTLIEKSIPDAEAIVLDPMNDGEHLQAFVISPAFDGLMLVKQHQMVMQPLKHAFASSVHALGLKTFTPEQWQTQKQRYGF